MKFYSISISIIFLSVLFSCETIINPKLENAEPVLVVDAWITSSPAKQTIKLTQTKPYFDNTALTGVTGATVSVKNETDGRTFVFNQNGAEGKYEWLPATATDSIGKTGDNFTLTVINGTEQYSSATQLGRVPALDSITFTYQKPSGIIPEHYLGEFWANDPDGKGDTYWIKAWKNDTLLLKPSEINIAFDAGFSEGGAFDGTTFIAPIRQAISPFEVDDNNKFISPYKFGDSVYVEIHSISKQAFNFLTQVVIQTDRPGGFSELFAAPFSNVSTNIFNNNQNGKRAVGFFNVGSVRGKGKKFVQK